jgi:taurine dioxygenase
MKISKLTQNFGAKIEDVSLSNLSDKDFDAIKHAWHTHHGLVAFPRVNVSDDDLLAFSKRLGELDSPPNQENGRQSPEGYPDMYVVSNVKDGAGKPIGALGDGEAVWHTDMSYESKPPLASMLTAREIPSVGGDTWFCDMIGIYEDLPTELKKQIQTALVKHDGTYNSGGYLRAGVTASDDPRTAAGTLHPAVTLIPEIRAAALYLGRRRMAYVAGKDLDDSELLLNALWTQVEKSQRVYKHQWQIGDLVLWDNRCTMHRRDAFPSDQRRIMHRTQVKSVTKPLAFYPEALEGAV